jgi:hypothetical protein
MSLLKGNEMRLPASVDCNKERIAPRSCNSPLPLYSGLNSSTQIQHMDGSQSCERMHDIHDTITNNEARPIEMLMAFTHKMIEANLIKKDKRRATGREIFEIVAENGFSLKNALEMLEVQKTSQEGNSHQCENRGQKRCYDGQICESNNLRRGRSSTRTKSIPGRRTARRSISRHYL